jgi:hypothetical protein
MYFASTLEFSGSVEKSEHDQKINETNLQATGKVLGHVTVSSTDNLIAF